MMIITEGDIRVGTLIMEETIVIMAGDMITGTVNMTGEHMIKEITALIITMTGTEGYIMRRSTGSSVPGHLEAVWW
jgi:hypothetical protein